MTALGWLTRGIPERTRTKLLNRCVILAEAVVALQPVYQRGGVTDDQKRLLETTIGAAIWYLPQPSALWSGMMSCDAWKRHDAGHSTTKDHEWPRKLAARELLTLPPMQITGSGVFKLYTERYGRFNRVTREENRHLMKFQKEGLFTSPEECYRAAGIALLTYEAFRSETFKETEPQGAVNTLLGRD